MGRQLIRASEIRSVITDSQWYASSFWASAVNGDGNGRVTRLAGGGPFSGHYWMANGGFRADEVWGTDKKLDGGLRFIGAVTTSDAAYTTTVGNVCTVFFKLPSSQ
ncbi:MAG: hypothetical protein ACOYNL_02780 [Rickettsiales bacterium]